VSNPITPVINRKDIEAAVPLAAEYTTTEAGRRALFDQIEALVRDTEAATRKSSLGRAEILRLLAKPPAKMPERDGFRLVVETGLRLMLAGFGHFLQTTHGMVLVDKSVENVLKHVAEAYANPTSYNISNADQAVTQFLKAV